MRSLQSELALRHIVGGKRGLTLIETLLALAIFGIAIPTIGYVFGTSFQQESENAMRMQALFLAQGLMQEISQKKMRQDPSHPENCATADVLSGYDRSLFATVEDYGIFFTDCAGTTAWGELKPPRDETGNSLTDFSKFSQMVTVVNIDPPGIGPNARADYTAKTDGTTDFKLVTVKISWNSGGSKVELHKIFALH